MTEVATHISNTISSIKIKRFVIKEKKIESEVLKDASVVYVKVVFEINGEERVVDLEVDVEDIPHLLRDDKLLVEKLIQAASSIIDLSNIQTLTTLTTELAVNKTTIKEELERAWRDYISGKMGVKITEYDNVLVPKSHVFIEKQLKCVVNKYLIIVHELGKKPVIVGQNLSPRQQAKLIHELTTNTSILEELGIRSDNSSKLYVYVRKYPYLFFHKSDNNIIISHKPLHRGDIQLRLRVLTRNELVKILEEIPENDLRAIAWEVAKALRSEELLKEYFKLHKDDYENACKSFFLSNANKIFYAETGLPKDYVDYYMSFWRKYLERIHELIEVDPLIKIIYQAMILEWFKPEYSPHVLLITSTNAGKTLLYREFVGRDPLSDVTPKTLVGHFSQEERKVVRGILHGQRLAVQIESLETKTAREVLTMLIDYMKSGRACRGVGREICVEGSAPIILTGNIVMKKKAPTLQTWMKLGLMDNPEALSSRLLLFYKSTKKLSIKDVKDFRKLTEIIREIRDSNVISSKLRMIWSLPLIDEWLNKPDTLHVDVLLDENLSELQQYLEGLARNFAPRLRALALNAALVDHLDQIHYNTVDHVAENLIPKILEKAQEYYEILRLELATSIDTVQEEYSLTDPTLLALNLQKPYVKLILAVHDYMNKNALNKEEISIPIDEALKILEEEGEKHIKQLKYRIVKQYWNNTVENTLSKLGLRLVFSSDNVEVHVTKSMFDKIEIDKLREALGWK